MRSRYLSNFKLKNISCNHYTKACYISTASLTTKSKVLRPLSERGTARTRFAPSPTGYLHLGSLRTALFNYLVAKATGGQFLLRVEDTDQKRTLPDAIRRLYEDLRWTGIQWDEGPDIGGPFGPYQQSKRLHLYAEYANELITSGNAYRCFCSSSRLTSLAIHRSQLGLPNEYDRHCAQITVADSNARAARGKSHVIRFKAPPTYPSFHDLVYGLVKQNVRPISNDSFDDPILLKSDGFPTYHFANVVDDHLMEITDVIRGAEWISSTHKHIALYDAFGWKPPRFAHVGLLLDESGQKLSKRTGATDVAKFRSEGMFPESLTNFVALLGWSHRKASEVMSLKDLIQNASMKYTKGDTIVNYDKLRFLQRRHAARYVSSPSSDQPLHSLRHLAVLPIIKELEARAAHEDFSTYTNIPQGNQRETFVQRLLVADSNNYTTPKEFIQRNIYFFVAPSRETLKETFSSSIAIYEPSEKTKKLSIQTLLILFHSIYEIELEEWDIQTLRARLSWIIEQRIVLNDKDKMQELITPSDSVSREKTKKAWSKFVHDYLRWALCAGKPGPDGVSILSLLGKEIVCERLWRAEKLLNAVLEDDAKKLEVER